MLRRRSNLGLIFLRGVVVPVDWLARVVGYSYVVDGETCIKLAVSRLEQLRLRPQEAELARQLILFYLYIWLLQYI